MNIWVTGSLGLIGYEVSLFYLKQGYTVSGIDNDLRTFFFGHSNSTKTKSRLEKFKKYCHYDVDIRELEKLEHLFFHNPPDLLIHCAAQPSHDWAVNDPLLDFHVNARSTLNLLEATRKANSKACFVFLSTNKVYGDAPNQLPMVESEKRWELKSLDFPFGIHEGLSIDRSMHSLFGASKLSADIYVQEYGNYFGLKTVCFRAGCLTGAHHAGAEQHGFLSYFLNQVKHKRKYKVIGYRGKQVRDQLHASDMVSAIDAFVQSPRVGEVYNLGGGYPNSLSILEAVDFVQDKYNIKVYLDFIDQARKGDHCCYYSDTSRFKRHYPNWQVKVGLTEIFDTIWSNF